jgi:hypothetical protein
MPLATEDRLIDVTLYILFLLLLVSWCLQFGSKGTEIRSSSNTKAHSRPFEKKNDSALGNRIGDIISWFLVLLVSALTPLLMSGVISRVVFLLMGFPTGWGTKT